MKNNIFTKKKYVHIKLEHKNAEGKIVFVQTLLIKNEDLPKYQDWKIDGYFYKVEEAKINQEELFEHYKTSYEFFGDLSEDELNEFYSFLKKRNSVSPTEIALKETNAYKEYMISLSEYMEYVFRNLSTSYFNYAITADFSSFLVVPRKDVDNAKNNFEIWKQKTIQLLNNLH